MLHIAQGQNKNISELLIFYEFVEKVSAFLKMKIASKYQVLNSMYNIVSLVMELLLWSENFWK